MCPPEFSILLKDSNVDDATIAYLLGHTTTEQVQKTYKRHRPKNQVETMSHLQCRICRLIFKSGSMTFGYIQQRGRLTGHHTVKVFPFIIAAFVSKMERLLNDPGLAHLVVKKG